MYPTVSAKTSLLGCTDRCPTMWL